MRVERATSCRPGPSPADRRRVGPARAAARAHGREGRRLPPRARSRKEAASRAAGSERATTEGAAPVPGARRRSGDGRRLEERRERELPPRRLLDLGEEAHRQERMPSEVEEVVVPADRARAEQRFPDLHQVELERVPGWLVVLFELAAGASRAAAGPSGRPFRSESREGVEAHERGRHHELGQTLRAGAAESTRGSTEAPPSERRRRPAAGRRECPPAARPRRPAPTGCSRIAASISPSSTRNPRILT